MPRSIAIVEDEPALRDNYRDILRHDGYQVSCYGDRSSALEGLSQRLPDMVLIDIGLGDEPEGGYELCRTLRSDAPALPIMFLTARDSEIDEISGLRLGADDYLSKGISRAHLMVRIHTLFERVAAQRASSEDPKLIRQGALEIDLNRMSAHWNGKSLELTLTELWMVLALARHPGHLKSRQQLMDAAHIVVDENTVTSHIRRVRRKFQEIDPDTDPIKTEYGIGYRWRSP